MVRAKRSGQLESFVAPEGTHCLSDSFVLQDRFTRLAALIDSSLRLRSEASETQLRLRDFLAPSLSRVTQEHALYKLLMLSNSLSALEVDVRRQESCLETVLKSDEEPPVWGGQTTPQPGPRS
eukprot:g29930.t1